VIPGHHRVEGISVASTVTTRSPVTVAGVQGVFYLATGVWPLVDVDSFQAVTGPQTALWLVQRVGVLVAVIGATLLYAALSRRVPREVAVLAVGAALGLAAVDVVSFPAG